MLIYHSAWHARRCPRLSQGSGTRSTGCMTSSAPYGDFFSVTVLARGRGKLEEQHRL